MSLLRSVRHFLAEHADPRLWSDNLETQILFDPDLALEPAYEGNKLVGHIFEFDRRPITLKPIRINSPRDRELLAPLDPYVLCIGSTGWDYEAKRSVCVGFDFDDAFGHKTTGLPEEEIEAIKNAVSQVPWVEVRLSTGGRGLHLRVYLDIPTANHDEHAKLARYILALIGKAIGHRLETSVDVCGQVLWIWHRHAHPDAYRILKPASAPCPPIPADWKTLWTDEKPIRKFAASQRTEFSGPHRDIEQRICEMGFACNFDPEHNCLKTHTKALELIAQQGNIVGAFKTISEGTEPHKQNCYAFPLPNGAFRVVRYGKGTREHESWHQDGEGWTWTMFNARQSIRHTAHAMGGIQVDSGTWEFKTFHDAHSAIEAAVGPTPIESPGAGPVTLKLTGKGLLLKAESRESVSGWCTPDHSGHIKKFIPYQEPTTSIDDFVICLKSEEGEIVGYAFRDDSGQHLKCNEKVAQRQIILKQSTDLAELESNPFTLVSIPFAPEFPGNRQWNRNAPQWKHTPAQGDCPHWDNALAHWGRGINSAVAAHPWCRQVGIFDGSTYLLHWIANVFRRPQLRLPWLFFYGPQDCGKSSFHEFLSLLVTRGVVAADCALFEKFNGQLAGAIIAYCSETDLSDRKLLSKIKDLTTAEQLWIREMRTNAYPMRSYLHWVSTGNKLEDAPAIDDGDTRFTFIETYPLEAIIPKSDLIVLLEKQAPAFLYQISQFELIKPQGRLALPALDSHGKAKLTKREDSRNSLLRFMDERVSFIKSGRVAIDTFVNAYEAACKEWNMPALNDKDRVQTLKDNWNIGNTGRLLSTDDPTRPKAYIGIQLKQSVNGFPTGEGVIPLPTSYNVSSIEGGNHVDGSHLLVG